MKILKFFSQNKYYFYAYLLDFFAWLYFFGVSYEVFYKRIILEGTESLIIFQSPVLFFGASFLLSFTLFFIPYCSVGKKLFLLHLSSFHGESVQLFKLPYFWIIGLFVLVTLICGFNITQLSFVELFSYHGFLGVKRIFSALLTPDFSIINDALTAVVETFFIAFMATFLSVPFAFMISFFSSSNLMRRTFIHRVAYFILRIFLNITRSIEPLVWAIIFSVWVGIGPFAGMLALMLHSISALSKLYSEQIENIEHGPQEMILSTGANSIQVIWFGVVPQILIPFLSFTIYRWDINLRMATIIGLVGGGGIGQMLIQYQGLAQWHRVGTIIFVIAIVVSLMDYFSMVVRQKLKRG